MEKRNALEWIEAPLTQRGMIQMIPPNAKYTIITDWFQQILVCTDQLVQMGTPLDEYSYDAGNIMFRKMRFAANMFQHGYQIYFKGRPFARLHVSPKQNGVLDDNNMQIEIENNVQYEVGWLDDLKYIYRVMKWSVQNSSKLDIALDGKGFFSVWEKYVTGEISRKGHHKEQEFRTPTGGVRVLDGFDVGSRSSDKWITSYNKSKRIEVENKGYIRDFWERSGMDVKNVERLELKLRNESLKEIGFDWTRIDDFEYLASIFRTYVEGGFSEFVDQYTGEVIRKNRNGILTFIEVNQDKNISRKRKIQFIDWDYIGAKPLERYTTERGSEVWAMKVSIKKLVQCAVGLQQQAKIHTTMEVDGRVIFGIPESDKRIYVERADAFMFQAREMAKNINCSDWMKDHFEEWVDEFRKRKFRYLPNYRVACVGEQLRLVEIPES